jgi:hypothetical protein
MLLDECTTTCIHQLLSVKLRPKYVVSYIFHQHIIMISPVIHCTATYKGQRYKKTLLHYLIKLYTLPMTDVQHKKINSQLVLAEKKREFY